VGRADRGGALRQAGVFRLTHDPGQLSAAFVAERFGLLDIDLAGGGPAGPRQPDQYHALPRGRLGPTASRVAGRRPQANSTLSRHDLPFDGAAFVDRVEHLRKSERQDDHDRRIG